MKRKFPRLFRPYGKNSTEEFRQDLSKDPKLILDRISEDCAQPDTRKNAVDPKGLEDFKPAIEAAQKLYNQGEFKKLAWLMFGLGRQTTYLDFWPMILEGKIHIEGYNDQLDDIRPKERYNKALQSVIDDLVENGDTFAGFKRYVESITDEQEGSNPNCDDYYCDGDGNFCWKDRTGAAKDMKIDSLRNYFKRALGEK